MYSNAGVFNHITLLNISINSYSKIGVKIFATSFLAVHSEILSFFPILVIGFQ